MSCFPEFSWMNAAFENATTKAALGVPGNVTYTPVNQEVGKTFVLAGDQYVRPASIRHSCDPEEILSTALWSTISCTNLS